MQLLIFVTLALCMGMIGAQRAPCYQCEMYKDTHPHSHPYSAVRAHCVYPCSCDSVPKCPAGVPLIRDGCGCCWQCARSSGEQCDGVVLCDTGKGLTCHYNSSADAKGTCKETPSPKCVVNSITYEDGQTFTMDCHTQCTCQNGTYACVSLCPGESIPPSSECHNPHLVKVPGQCCREWMCDASPDKAVAPPSCDRSSGKWSPCSVDTCGVGVSVRWSTDNSRCEALNQTRLCQLRPCLKKNYQPHLYNNVEYISSKRHHIRRGHTCKATQRATQSVRLQVGWCVSERKYRPKQCGYCSGRCCEVYSSTTITVAFLCPLHSNTDLLASRRKRRRRRSRSQDLLLERSRIDYQETIVTTPPPSVYEMMDEGQPVLDESLAYQHQQQQKQQQQQKVVEEAFLERLISNENPRPSLETNPKGKALAYSVGEAEGEIKGDMVYLVAYDNENLTVDDDAAFERIKKDNYKVVHHRVQWILRCKCRDSCEKGSISDDIHGGTGALQAQSLDKTANSLYGET